MTTTLSLSTASSEKVTYDEVIFIRKVGSDSEGNTVLIGITDKEDAYIAKFDANMELDWQEVFGGSGPEAIAALEIAGDGSIFVAGITSSSDFPLMNAVQDHHGGEKDFFIRKFDSDGVVQWSTYFGGMRDEESHYSLSPIQIDSQGNLILLGFTDSESGLILKNAFELEFKGDVTPETTNNFPADLFVAKFQSNGDLVWSSYFGTEEHDWAHLLLDHEDNIILRGGTPGTDLILSENGRALEGNRDPHLTKINPEGELVFSTYWGGSEDDNNWIPMIDSENNIIMLGATASDDFPTSLGAAQSTFGEGNYDAYLTKFAPDGTVLWSTYFGGSGNDMLATQKGSPLPTTAEVWYRPTIYLDRNDNIILKTLTESTDIADFHPNVDTRSSAGSSPFIAKIAKNGSVVFGKYFPTNLADAVITDDDGIFVGGYAASPGWPVTSNAAQSEIKGGQDITYAKLSSNGTVEWASYFGGTNSEQFDKPYSLHGSKQLILGQTTSDDLPHSVNEYNGGGDAFIAQINSDGEVGWSQYLGGSDLDKLESVGVHIGEDGSLLLAGITDSSDFPPGGDNPEFESTAFIVKIDENGQQNSASILLPPARVQEEGEQFDTTLLIIIVAISTAFVISGYFFRVAKYRSKGIEEALLNINMSEILSPMFKSHPQLIHLFGATKVLKQDKVPDEVLSDIPQEIMDFKYFLHPVRMSMIKLLDENVRLTTVQIKESLGITWNEATTHLDSLRKNGFVSIEQQFVDGYMRSVVEPEPQTLAKFKMLREVLMDFLDATPNLDKYIEHVSTLKMRSEDPDLYPKDDS